MTDLQRLWRPATVEPASGRSDRRLVRSSTYLQQQKQRRSSAEVIQRTIMEQSNRSLPIG